VKPADQLLEEVMWLVRDDMTGLWEAVRVANTDFPDISEPERLKLAKEVVGNLLAHGWVELYERNADGVPHVERPVDPSRVEAALADDIGWDWRGVLGGATVAEGVVGAATRLQRRNVGDGLFRSQSSAAGVR
jgi:hypothetical protein